MPETPPTHPRHLRRLTPHAARILRIVGRFIAFGLLPVELLYLIIANTVLNLPIIPKQIDGEDEGMKWSYALSLYPGQATVHGFFMRIQDANIQFTLSIGVAHAHFTLNDLLHRTFHVTRVDGEHAVYLMRMRRTPEEVAQTDLSTLPLLEGFPAVPLRRAVEPPPSPPATPQEIAGIWTVHIEGVHVVVDEGWFEGLRFRGVSAATGSFTLKPQHLVIVDGHWHVTKGNFTYGHDPLFDDAHGDASVRITPFDPQQAPGNMPLRYLDGLLNLEGRLSNARFLDPVLGKTAPHFGSNEGSFEVYFHFDRGLVATGTHLRLQAKNWKIRRGRYLVTASYAKLDSSVDDVAGTPTGITRLDLGPYDVRRTPEADDPGGELLTGDGMALLLFGTQLDTLGPFLYDLSYEFKLHEARMSDLRRLNAYLPNGRFFEVLGGEGTLSGDFVSPADGNGHGMLELAAKDAAVRAQRVRFGGDLRLHVDLTGVASDSERLVVVGNRPLGAKGQMEGNFRVRRPDDLAAAFPPVGTCELTGDFTLDPLTVPDIARKGFWSFLSANASLKGRFEGLEFIGGLLPSPAPVAISGGAGDFTVDGHILHGEVGPESRVDLHADGIQVAWSDYRALADARLSVAVREPAEASLEGKFALSKARLEVGGETIFSADELALSGSSPRLEMDDLMRARPSLALRTTNARIPELRVLNRYLPGQSFRLEGGSAAIEAEVTSPPSGEGHATLAIAVDKVGASYEDLALQGGVHLTSAIRGLGQAPWRPGIWERTRLSANAKLDSRLALQPGPKSKESGLVELGVVASAELPALPQGDPPRWQDVVNGTVAHATVGGKVHGVGYLNRFLGTTGLRAEDGNGRLSLSLGLAQGELAAGSWANVNLDGVVLRAGSFVLATTTDVTAVVGAAGPNRLSLGLGLDTYEVRYVPRSVHAAGPVADPVLLHGAGLRLELRSDDLDPVRIADVASLHAEMGAVRVPDLRALNLFLPAWSAAGLSGGEARLTGVLEKPAHGKSKALLQLNGTGVTLELDGHQLKSDFQLTGSAATVIPGAGWSLPHSIDLSGSGFAINNVSFEKEADIEDGWWMTLGLPRAALALGETPAAVGRLDLKARDARPIFVLFRKELGIPEIFTRYLGFDGMHGGANLLVQHEFIEVTEADVRSTRLRLRGRILANSTGTHGELLLNDPPLAFGVALHLHATGVQLWGAEGWYEDRLKTPLVHSD